MCLTRCGMRPAAMDGSSVETGGHVPLMDYIEANVKSLIFTIGVPPRFITFAYCASLILMHTPRQSKNRPVRDCLHVPTIVLALNPN